MKTRSFVKIAAAFSVMLCSAPAFAYTQCQSTVVRVWAGDGGYLWIDLANGGAPVITANDPNREAILSMAITALTGSRQVIVRYAADGVDCAASGRQDVLGMYLL